MSSSWLARSLANSLRLDDDDDDDSDDEDNDVVLENQCGEPSTSSPTEPLTQFQQHLGKNHHHPNGIESEEEGALNRGVKEDLSEFKQALTRQFWGVASFLAPPPSHPSTPSNRLLPNWDQSQPSDQSDPVPITPWKEEEEQQQEEECYMEDAVGITDEVLAFARNIAMHPETWLDFPLDEEEDLDDFDMSGAQQEHAMAIERLAPRLAALRIELCPCHMSEGYFWKVYFVLLHSRLNKQDAETLSTPQVMAARAKWMQELQNHNTSDSEWYGRSTSFLKESTDFLHDDIISISSFGAHCEDTLVEAFPSQSTMYPVPTAFETDKHPVESSELQFVDKSVIEEKPMVKTEDKNLTVGSSNILVKNHEDDDDDDWPEEDFEFNEYSGTSIPVENEDDISFSDLEDDDFQAPARLKVVSKDFEKSTKDR